MSQTFESISYFQYVGFDGKLSSISNLFVVRCDLECELTESLLACSLAMLMHFVVFLSFFLWFIKIYSVFIPVFYTVL